MAESDYHGKSSEAWWGLDTADTVAALSELTNVIEWSITLAAGTAESTAMHASSTGKTRELGFKGATATVTCHLSGDVEIDEGQEGALELLRSNLNADKGYALGAAGASGKGVICIGVDVGVDKDGVETVTYSFQSTGTVTSTLTKGS